MSSSFDETERLCEFLRTTFGTEWSIMIFIVTGCDNKHALPRWSCKVLQATQC